MSDLPQAPHLTMGPLIETLRRGAQSRQRWRWITHLSQLCPECWETLESGLAVRLLPGRKPPDLVALALCRLLAYHAPEPAGRKKAQLLLPLYPRHRQALATAHQKPLGFSRLVLEESQLGLSYEMVEAAKTTPIEMARSAVDLIPSVPRSYLEDFQDLKAWGEAGLARAVHRQGGAGDRIRQHVQLALNHAQRGTGEPWLRATLYELQSLPADLKTADKVAYLDQALGLLRGAAWNDLRAELLLAKARCFAWQPEEGAATCRKALELLDDHSPPLLRIAILDQLAAVASELGKIEEARSSWLEAQRFSEPAGEQPFRYCRRWAHLARLPSPEDPDRREAAYRAAIWGYRSIELRDEATRLLVELAHLHLREDRAERFIALEEELAKELESGSPQALRLLAAAREKNVPVMCQVSA